MSTFATIFYLTIFEKRNEQEDDKEEGEKDVLF